MVYSVDFYKNLMMKCYVYYFLFRLHNNDFFKADCNHYFRKEHTTVLLGKTLYWELLYYNCGSNLNFKKKIPYLATLLHKTKMIQLWNTILHLMVLFFKVLLNHSKDLTKQRHIFQPIASTRIFYNYSHNQCCQMDENGFPQTLLKKSPNWLFFHKKSPN